MERLNTGLHTQELASSSARTPLYPNTIQTQNSQTLNSTKSSVTGASRHHLSLRKVSAEEIYELSVNFFYSPLAKFVWSKVKTPTGLCRRAIQELILKYKTSRGLQSAKDKHLRINKLQTPYTSGDIKRIIDNDLDYRSLNKKYVGNKSVESFSTYLVTLIECLKEMDKLKTSARVDVFDIFVGRFFSLFNHFIRSRSYRAENFLRKLRNLVLSMGSVDVSKSCKPTKNTKVRISNTSAANGHGRVELKTEVSRVKCSGMSVPVDEDFCFLDIIKNNLKCHYYSPQRNDKYGDIYYILKNKKSSLVFIFLKFTVQDGRSVSCRITLSEFVNTEDGTKNIFVSMRTCGKNETSHQLVPQFNSTKSTTVKQKFLLTLIKSLVHQDCLLEKFKVLPFGYRGAEFIKIVRSKFWSIFGSVPNLEIPLTKSQKNRLRRKKCASKYDDTEQSMCNSGNNVDRFDNLNESLGLRTFGIQSDLNGETVLQGSVSGGLVEIGRSTPVEGEELHFQRVGDVFFRFILSDDGGERVQIYLAEKFLATYHNDAYVIRKIFNLLLSFDRQCIPDMAMTPDGDRFMNHKRDYCWLSFFRLRKKFLPSSLIPFPCLNLRYLTSLGLRNRFNKFLCKTGQGLVHFEVPQKDSVESKEKLS